VNVSKIGSKAGNFLSGKREGGGEIERQIDREIERQRDRETKKQSDRADNKNPEQSRVSQLV
jgi:hypothetical protein